MTETIDYIRRLEEERERLERLKRSNSPGLMAVLSTCSNRGSSVTVADGGGGVAFFGIEMGFRRGLVAEVFGVFEDYGVEILAANVAVDDQRERVRLTVTAVVGSYRGDEVIDKIKRDILVI